MKIVAFLQNQWFRDPEKVKATIQRTIDREGARGGKAEHEVREFYIAAFLFMGCLTGRRLRAAFGEKLCGEIIWQEQSPEIGGKASALFPPDPRHIHSVIERHQPTHVIALGVHAGKALTLIHDAARPNWKLILGPHPAARQADVMDRLKMIPSALEVA